MNKKPTNKILKTLTIEETFDLFNNSDNKPIFIKSTKNAKFECLINPDRIKLFMSKEIHKGIHCANCPRKAVTVHAERWPKMKLYTCTLNFYTADGIRLTVDHIIPVSKGGLSEMSNYQTLCEKCNTRKDNKTKHQGVFRHLKNRCSNE